MTTLVLNKATEQTTISEMIRNAASRVIEIRSEDGDLMATLTLPSAANDDFGYTPYMAEAQRIVDDHRRRPADSSSAVTTQELFDSLRRLDARQ